jgi:hypothetical protein
MVRAGRAHADDVELALASLFLISIGIHAVKKIDIISTVSMKASTR